MTTTLYWFRQDLRLHDNAALNHACTQSSELLPLVLREPDPADMSDTPWGFLRCGPNRARFRSQAAAGVREQLRQRGSELYQPRRAGIEGLIELAHEMAITQVVCEAIHAPEEQSEVKALRQAGIAVVEIDQSSLLSAEDLPFDPQKAPTVFTAFRQAVEKNKVRPKHPLAPPAVLPPLPKRLAGTLATNLTTNPPLNPSSLAAPFVVAVPFTPAADPRSAFPYQDADWHGDEASALAHVKRYFSSNLPQRYKQTRNGLVGTDYSTKFSPWLAVGALSPRAIWEALEAHEAERGQNDGTYWIWFELLWRDHFRLMMRRFGRRLFLKYGLLDAPPSPKADQKPAIFQMWTQGRTKEPFVDAGMRELAATGYLSNRMRQNVASYLIHELQGDWRAGAAWFEHSLIDYDVHSNQGNWAYIAGVGTDPRGGRAFNIQKQAQDYDRSGDYRKLWTSL